MYQIDFNKLVLWLIPAFLRKPKMYAWLQALIVPCITLKASFLNNRKTNLYKLSHGSQMFSIEAVLNDRFDKTDRRIKVKDVVFKERIYCDVREDAHPIYLNSPYRKTYIPLYNRVDYAGDAIDFRIIIPQVVSVSDDNLIEAKALVNFYKRASKRFEIYRNE